MKNDKIEMPESFWRYLVLLQERLVLTQLSILQLAQNKDAITEDEILYFQKLLGKCSTEIWEARHQIESITQSEEIND
jgi:hypothetical protein